MVGSSLENPRRQAILSALIDFWVVASATMLTASLGLLIEDLAPKGGIPAATTRERVAMLMGSLISLGVAMGVRQRRTRGRGTLYYVSFLGVGMTDLRLAAVSRSMPAHRDVRVVVRRTTRPTSLAGYPASAPVGAIDAVEELSDLSRAVEATMNEDQAFSGFNLAPNLLFPAALAFGYRLFRWPGLTLHEIDSRPFSTGPPKVLRKSNRLDFEPAETAGDNFDPATAVRWQTHHFPSVLHQVVPGSEGIDPRRAQVVAARLTGRLVRLDYVPKADMVEVGVWKGQRFGYGDHRALADFGEPAETVITTERVQPAASGPPGTKHLPVHPRVAVDTITEAIFACLHERPDAPVILYLLVPKTVAVAIGLRLAGPPENITPCRVRVPRAPHESCLQPWTRLIPVVSNQQRKALDIWRVHPAQPCIEILRRRVAYGRIDPESEQSHRARCTCPG